MSWILPSVMIVVVAGLAFYLGRFTAYRPEVRTPDDVPVDPRGEPSENWVERLPIDELPVDQHLMARFERLMSGGRETGNDKRGSVQSDGSST